MSSDTLALPVIAVDTYPMARMPHAWDIGFPDMAPSDRHPDVLLETDEYGRGVPCGWFVCTPFTNNDKAMVVKVTRITCVGPDHGMIMLGTPDSAVSYRYTYLQDGEGNFPLLRTRFTHPSREYVLEVARQLAMRERLAYVWRDGQPVMARGFTHRNGGWTCHSPDHVTVWEHRPDGPWRHVTTLPGEGP